MEVKSVQKHTITSAKKIREVIPLIKKLSPLEAYENLPFSGKKAALVLRKVVGSAIANAKQKGLKEDRLFFKEIQINEGPRLKRWRAGARGMAKPYKKRMSHIRVVLGVRKEEVSEKKGKKEEKIVNSEKSKNNDKKLKSRNQKQKPMKKAIEGKKK